SCSWLERQRHTSCDSAPRYECTRKCETRSKALNLNDNNELTLRDLSVVFRRRRNVIYGAMAVLALLAAIYCVFSTRQYESTGTLQVQSKSQDRLGLDNRTADSGAAEPDALAANINIQ